MSYESLFNAAEHLAVSQLGLVTTTQLIALGYPVEELDRMLESGAIHRESQNVLRLSSSPEFVERHIWIAWLEITQGLWTAGSGDESQPPAVVSHLSAAELHQFAVPEAPSPTFVVPAIGTSPDGADVRLVPLPLNRDQWVVVNGLPTMSPAECVVQLLTEGVDRSHVGNCVVEGLHRRLFTGHEILGTLGRPIVLDVLSVAGADAALAVLKNAAAAGLR